MFSSPAIFGHPRHFSESPGLMPLNALNGSATQMVNDEKLTSHGLPSYEEAVTNGSMFGLFNVNGGDEIHQHDTSPTHQPHQPETQQQQHSHHGNDDRRHHSYHSLLTPKSSSTSEGKAANQQCLSVSCVTDAAERLDLSSESSDSHATHLSRISVVSTLSVQRSPCMPSPEIHPRNSENKMAASAKGKASGKGSGGGRKYLTVDRCTLSSAKERLYRVFSPVLGRKHEHQETSKKAGRDSKRDAGDKDRQKVKASSHPVRMRISSGRYRSSGADHFDDIRATEKPHKDRHHKHHSDSK